MKRGAWGLVPAGVVLVLAAVGLAWWNESSAVRSARALAEGAWRTISVSAEALPATTDGSLVHATGPLGSAAGVADPLLGVLVDAVRVRRTVEAYQWRRSSRSGDPDGEATYHLEWSDRRIDSSGWPAEYRNPVEPVLGTVVLDASDATFAGVPVDADLLARGDGFVAVPVDAALVAAVAGRTGLPVAAQDGALFLAQGGGRSDAPRVGDVRVRLERVPTGTFSLVALLRDGRLQPAPTRSGVPVAILRAGSHSVDALFASAEAERRGRAGLFRGLAVAASVLGFRMALHPLVALAGLVPLLGGLLRVGVNGAALAMGAGTAAATVALAWVAVRPALALPLLALGVAAVVWLLRRPRPAAPPGATVVLALLVAAAPWTARAQADATPAIASADALVAAVAAGGTHHLAAGTIRLSGPLEVARDLTLVGAGRTATRVELAAPATGMRVTGGAAVRLEGLTLAYAGDGGDLLRVDAGHVALRDCALEGARWAASDDPERRFGVGVGLVVLGDATASVAACAVHDHELAAIEASGDARVDVDDVRLEGPGTGVFADGGSALGVARSRFVGFPGNALHLRGEARATITDVTFERSGGLGATGADGLDAVRVGERAHATFDGVAWLDHPRFALSLWGEAQVGVRGGRFVGNGGTHPDGTAIYSAVLAAEQARLAIDGTAFEANPGGGLEALGTARVDLREATFVRNGTFATVYASERASLTFVGGVVEANDGALFAAGEATLALNGTVVRDGLGVGVRLVERARGALFAAEIVDHADAGVTVEGAATLVLRDAFVAGNRDGVVAFDDAEVVAEGGVVVANRESGVVLVDRARGSMRGGRVAGHVGVGVAVFDDAWADVEGNRFEGNLAGAARFGERAGGRFVGNTVRDGEVGVRLEGAVRPVLEANTFEGVDRPVDADE